jgi:hypothetical protein
MTTLPPFSTDLEEVAYLRVPCGPMALVLVLSALGVLAAAVDVGGVLWEAEVGEA